jgi:Tol biopolymer transport system component
VPSGHLVFVQNGTLFVARLDPDSLDLGRSVPLPQHVIHNLRQHATQLAFSSTGTLVYVPAPQRNRKLVWVDDRGRIEPLAAPAHAYNSVSLAPGNARIGLSIESKASVQTDVWLYDIPRSTLTPLTFDGLSMMPQWLDSPQELAYLKSDPLTFMCDLSCLYVDGTKDEKLIARVPGFFERGYSIDERRTCIVGTMLVLPDENQDLMLIDLNETDSREIPIADDGWQRLPTFSSDGQWLAYSSFETGTWEVYVKSFPELKAKTKISNAGGYEPLWDPHGNKLYYRNGDEMWMVTYQAGETFEPSPPQFLFERHFFGGLASKQKTYAVAEDGRFLMIQEDVAPGAQINVVLNWFEELERLMPAEKKQ